MNELNRRIIKHHWFDIVAIIVAWLYFLNFHSYSMKHRGEEFYLLFPVVVLPLWILFRMCPVITMIAKRERREQIAVTLMPASKYIYSKMKWPLLLTLAPFIGMLIPWIMAHFRGDEDFASFVVVFIYAGISPIIVQIMGLTKMLQHICKKQYVSAASILTFYSIFSIIGTLMLAFLIGDLYYDSRLYVLLLCISLNLVLFMLLMINWKRACAAYYKFE